MVVEVQQGQKKENSLLPRIHLDLAEKSDGSREINQPITDGIHH